MAQLTAVASNGLRYVEMTFCALLKAHGVSKSYIEQYLQHEISSTCCNDVTLVGRHNQHVNQANGPNTEDSVEAGAAGRSVATEAASDERIVDGMLAGIAVFAAGSDCAATPETDGIDVVSVTVDVPTVVVNVV